MQRTDKYLWKPDKTFCLCLPCGLSWSRLLPWGLSQFSSQVLVSVTFWLRSIAGTWSEAKHLKWEAHVFYFLILNLFLLILSYNQAEKGLSGKISHFLRSQSQTTPPPSPRRDTVSSPDSPRTSWNIILVEHFTVCKKLSSMFSYLIFIKGLWGRPGRHFKDGKNKHQRGKELA